MRECEVLKTSTLDGTSKTSEWLLSSNFSTGYGDHKPSLRSTSAEKNSRVKLGDNDTKISSEPPHHRRRKHRRSKSHKKTHCSGFPHAIRFKRTASVLSCSGLLQLSNSISQLLHNNEMIQTEIEKLRYETKEQSLQLHRQIQKKLEAEIESSGSFSQEGQKLLTKLSQFEWNWIVLKQLDL